MRDTRPRRDLLRRAAGLALAGLGPVPFAGCAPAARRVASDPFTLGVASGCPEPDGVVLWTRLAPDPRAADGGLDPLPVEVRWEVAEDDAFRRIVRGGGTTAVPDRAHAVHVEVDGLRPARGYFYRFHAAGATSPVGRTQTAPAAGAPHRRMRLALASCQHYEQGHYGAYRHMAAEDVDLVVHVGDYIYESSWGRDHVRKHWTPEPKTLDGYRVRYAQTKTDPDLQRMHAAAPWLATWDDHEVENDYANDRSQTLAPDFLARRAAAYRAYFEHLPLRALARPVGADARIYGRWAFGDLAECFVLDDRQYRSHQSCPRPGRGGSNVVENCAELFDPARTMLGAEQERWLARGLRDARGRWTVIAQQTLFARFDTRPGPGERFWTDGWSGYPAAAARLTRDLVDSRARNPLVLGGDVHAHYVCDLKSDWSDPASKTVATEFCGTSITSQSLPQAQIDAGVRENPNVLLGDGTKRGYVVLDLERERCTARLRTIDDVKRADTGVSTRATFVVEDGRPGAQRA